MKKNEVVTHHNFSSMISDLGVFAASSVGYLTEPFFKTPTPSIPNQARQLSEKYQECIELMELREEEINLIQTALDQCSQDVIASEHDMNEYVVTDHRVQMMIKASETSQSKSLEHRIVLLNHLSELLDSYPVFSTDESTTLNDLNTFRLDHDQHHASVLSIVEVYLPETYAAINAAKDIQRGLHK